MKQARTIFLFLGFAFATPGFSQPELGDSTYLRMADHATAFAAMRFDMDAYRDTLRAYRDALETTATGIDAMADEGQDRKARLGQLREDVKALDKEMKRQRKRLKRDMPPFEQSARTCSDLVRRTKLLRTRLVEQGARPQQ
mgnify:CR=1 FL=1